VFVEAGLGAPRVCVESVSFLTNRALLQGGDLIALMPLHVAEEEAMAGRVALLDWTLPVGSGPVGVTLREGGGLSPAAEAFLDALRQVARTVQPGEAANTGTPGYNQSR
jgi:DNA-binding transcriptional LysR family regulator